MSTVDKQAQFPDSLWAKTASSEVLNGPRVESIEADVTIIGAGFTGIRAA